MREKVSLNVVNEASVLALRYEHNPEKKFHEILVPTADTERCQWLLKLMLGIKKPVILVGETGTAKTATIQSFLRTIEGDNNVSLVVDVVVVVESGAAEPGRKANSLIIIVLWIMEWSIMGWRRVRDQVEMSEIRRPMVMTSENVS